ncbi:MAG: hypothetical protein OXQ28_00590 [Acidobacteriota bacterium]|nr:hypothetical protein [Acidobacteriota bacterium]
MLGALKKAGKLAGIIRLVKPVAPLLAKGLEYAPGGPVVSSTLRAICNAVGGDPADPGSIEAALENASAENLVKLKVEADRLSVQLKKAEIDLDHAYIADTQDAREKHRDSWVPAFLGILMIGAHIGSMIFVLVAGARGIALDLALVTLVVGTLGPLAGNASSYWMGSSRTQDHAHGEAMRQSARPDGPGTGR